MTDIDLCSALREVVDVLSSFEKCGMVEFERAVCGVAALKDPRSITPLLGMLRDEAPDDSAMYLLIHAAEAFDDETYVANFINCAPFLKRNSPQWASVVMMRVLNNDSTRQIVTRRLRDSPDDVRDAAIWLLEGIDAEDSSFLAKTMAPLLAAKSKKIT